jgi:hypothetical protein
MCFSGRKGNIGGGLLGGTNITGQGDVSRERRGFIRADSAMEGAKIHTRSDLLLMMPLIHKKGHLHYWDF